MRDRTLASRTRRAAHSRTWLTVPGAAPTSGSKTVWMESTTRTSGPTSSIAARISGRPVSARRCSPGATAPRRSARSRTCAADSSAVTSRQRLPPSARAATRLEQQARLADPRLAAQQGHRARHEAAAEHPVELADAGRPGRLGRQVDLGQGHGTSSRPHPAGGRGAGGGRRALLDEGAPLVARRAAAQPLRAGVPAGGAPVDGPRSAHGDSMTRGCDSFRDPPWFWTVGPP